MRWLAEQIGLLPLSRAAVAAGAAGLATFYLIRQAITDFIGAYPVFTGRHPSENMRHAAALFVGNVGAPLLFLVLAAIAGFYVARKAGEKPYANATLAAALSAAVFLATVQLTFPPVLPRELALYPCLALLAGRGAGTLARNAIAEREALYRTTRRVGTASDPESVVAAVGEELGGPSIRGAALWRSVSAQSGRAYELLASWTPPGHSSPWNAGATLVEDVIPQLRRTSERRLTTLRPPDVPADQRDRFRSSGTRATVLVPLQAPDGTPVGLLSIELGRRRALPWATAREFLTVAPQVALALDNLRLVEQTRIEAARAASLAKGQSLARAIHDGIVQGDIAIHMTLRAALLAQDSDLSNEHSAARAYVEEALRVAKENVTEGRQLVRGQGPEPVEARSLHGALRERLEDLSRLCGAAVRMTVRGEPTPLPEGIQHVLYGAAQEALNNARKHSRAELVKLTLSYRPSAVTLEVSDDGIGFDPSSPPAIEAQDGMYSGGAGIPLMESGVRRVGGQLCLHTSPGTGTILVVDLPVPAPRTEGKLD